MRHLTRCLYSDQYRHKSNWFELPWVFPFLLFECWDSSNILASKTVEIIKQLIAYSPWSTDVCPTMNWAAAALQDNHLAIYFLYAADHKCSKWSQPCWVKIGSKNCAEKLGAGGLCFELLSVLPTTCLGETHIWLDERWESSAGPVLSFYF